MSKTNLATLASGLVIFFAMVGCGSSRQSVLPEQSEARQSVMSRSGAVNTADAQRYAEMMAHYGSWTDVRMPVSLKLRKPVSFSVSGQATMVNGRAMHISLRLLGFEVGAITLTPDSVIAYEKRGKRYIAESLKNILHGFPVTVGNIQSMLLGRPFACGSDMLTSADAPLFAFAPAEDQDMPQAWLMTLSRDDMHGASCTWIIDNVVKALFVSASSTAEATVTYDDFVDCGGAGSVAAETALSVVAGSRVIEAELDWNLRKAKWNTGASVDTHVPSGYTRIPASRLMKMLESF